MARRKRLARRLQTADTPRLRLPPSVDGALASATAWFRHPLRGGRVNPKPRAARATREHVPRQPRMRPRRSVADRVLPSGEPAAARPVIRLRVVGLVVMALFSLMLVRLWYLQVLDTSAYSRTVAANQIRPVELPAPRGLILDRAGNIMVGNQVTQDITLSRVAAQQHPAVIDALSTLLGIPTADIEATLANPQFSLYKPVPVLQNAPLADVLFIGEHASEFPGVSTVAETTRTYPLGPTAVQTLGYVGQISQLKPGYQLGDQIGKSGLEAQYESELRGRPGVDRVEVDAHGQVVGSLGTTPPTAGGDLVTNIDAGLEQTLQQALDQQIAALHGTIDPSTGRVVSTSGGAAVALDPQTGAVLAMVSSPTYDPTWWEPFMSSVHYAALSAPSANKPLLNRAIQGLYTPGSTFKLATATAALGTGLIAPGTYYDDTGSYVIPGCKPGAPGCVTYHDNDGEAAGYVNVTGALTVSSDVFFYNLGAQFWDARSHYGDTPIQDAANQLGYGVPTGIDLPGESISARVDSPEVVAREHAQDPKAYPNGEWYTGNNLEMAFGQGGTVITPLEQAVAYATFANGGTRYAPQIAAGVVDAGGKVLEQYKPRVVDHVAYAPDAYQAMLAGFEGVVQSPHGTGYGAFAGFPLSTFPLAGKTGTASGANGSVPTSWFVGWGPIPDPHYLIAVVVEAGGFGATAAAPVVRKGFDYIVAHPLSAVQMVPPATPNGTTPGSGTTPAASGQTGSPGATTGGPGASTTTAPPGVPPTTAPAATTTRAAPRRAVARTRRRVAAPPPRRPRSVVGLARSRAAWARF
ncbi:MAG TPA: penicillin-binding protein 2 [Acidimicrobiales bacterium]|nr:penicillin-binding protein 2 [Acidimicrobiales bacterium]